ncbi:hypothetical protein [Collimonas sp. OK412]|uniref:hypothetical protein n=1 Tax=Collimonas sp. (strain OK412) TaxID=1801619 RepID=UPI00352A2B38
MRDPDPEVMLGSRSDHAVGAYNILVERTKIVGNICGTNLSPYTTEMGEAIARRISEAA